MNLEKLRFEQLEDGLVHIYIVGDKDDGDRKGQEIWIATIFHRQKTIYPTHGYFYPHRYGKLVKKYAEQINYIFNNN